MIIRPARVDELPAVGELTLAAYVVDGFLDADADYAEELRDATSRSSDAELLVAASDARIPGDELLGTVTFCLAGTPWAEVSRPGEAEFRMLAVAPQARGRGVGGALAGWCVERARELGCTGVALCSMPGMRGAHRIYERMGFVRTPDRDWSPVPDLTLVAYLLDLDG